MSGVPTKGILLFSEPVCKCGEGGGGGVHHQMSGMAVSKFKGLANFSNKENSICNKVKQ